MVEEIRGYFQIIQKKTQDFFVSVFFLIFGVITGFILDDPNIPITLKPKRKVLEQNVDVLIVGAGISGIAIAKKLTDIGIKRYTILEQGSELGGTWYWNRYPGVACDVSADVYSFSWNIKKDWSCGFPGAEEIQNYLIESAEKFGILSHIKFDMNVVDAEWHEDTGKWKISTESGEEFYSRVFVHATGMLHQPLYPHIPGEDTFQGKTIPQSI